MNFYCPVNIIQNKFFYLYIFMNNILVVNLVTYVYLISWKIAKSMTLKYFLGLSLILHDTHQRYCIVFV